MFPKEKKTNIKVDKLVVEKFPAVANFHDVIKSCGNKWQQARIPLLACLFVEILSPAKVFSLAFQDNDIDTVSSIQRLETAKKQLARVE